LIADILPLAIIFDAALLLLLFHTRYFDCHADTILIRAAESLLSPPPCLSIRCRRCYSMLMLAAFFDVYASYYACR